VTVNVGLCLLKRISLKQMGTVLALGFFVAAPVLACTIFVLTDGAQALFFNNEDWSNTRSRIWFVPDGPGRYGCAYVGFDDGTAQGGVNTKGVAFDWVAGYMEDWPDDPSMKRAPGKPCERMLETCATVEDAIAFYRQHWEPGFSKARILVADSTRASAIIGANGGKLLIERSRKSRGFGFCDPKLGRILAKPPVPTVSNGAAIMRACLQPGETPTRYSNVYDLKSGDIFLFENPERDSSVKLHLAAELAKGGHYYDIPQVRKQITQLPAPLLHNMRRFFLGRVQPIPDKEPDVTKHLRAVFQAAAAGSTLRADDYTAEFWKDLSAQQQNFRAEFRRLGGFVSIALVDRWDEDRRRNYRYRTEFQNATLLQHFVLDDRNRIALMQSEDIELKPDVRR
jgi:hypothetical protein